MAKKGTQNSGGNRNIPAIEPDSERDRFLSDIKLATEGAFACIEKIKNLPAGVERDGFVEKAETILHDAEKTTKNIIGVDDASKSALGPLKVLRKQFEGLKKNLVGAGSAGIRAAEKAEQEERIRKEREERELVAMQQQEDTERFAREAEERIARGEATAQDAAAEDARQIKQVEAMLRPHELLLKEAKNSLDKENASDAKKSLDSASNALEAVKGIYQESAEASTAQGFPPADVPSLVVFAKKISQFEEKLNALRSRMDKMVQEQEAAEMAAKTREEVGTTFENKIAVLSNDILSVLAMPSGTLEEVNAAGEALEEARIKINAHKEAWRDTVIPVLPPPNSPQQAWGRLIESQRGLIDGFFGVNTKKTQIEGVYPKRRAELVEKLRQLHADAEGESRKRWDAELPRFALDVTKVELAILDANLLRGEQRTEQLKKISKNSLSEILEKWSNLRKSAPPLSPEQIASGMRTERKTFDGRVLALVGKVERSLEGAKSGYPVPLDVLGREWANNLSTTDRLWVVDTTRKGRNAFLEEYARGEIQEGSPEFSSMIPDDRREAFETVAHSEVFSALRRRGVQTREERAAEIQAARKNLDSTIPKLSLDRLLKDVAYTNFHGGSFWKRTRAAKRFRLSLGPHVVVSDEDAKKYVTDVPAFRAALDALAAAHIQVVATEDILIGENKDVHYLDGMRSVAEVRESYDTYDSWKKKEEIAFRAAIDADGWTLPKEERRERLLEFFEGYRQLGGAKAMEVERVPEELREVVRTWAFAGRNMIIYGRYTQWLLDENPEIAREMGPTLPREFRVPRQRKATIHRDDAVDESDEPVRTFSDTEREMLNLPAATERDTEGDYAGRVLEEGVFSGDGMTFAENDMEEDDDDNEPERSPGIVPAYSVAPVVEPAPAPAPALVPASEPSISPITMGAPSGMPPEIVDLLAGEAFAADGDIPKPLVPVRRDVPRPPRPVDGAPIAPAPSEPVPVRSEPIPVRSEPAPARPEPIPVRPEPIRSEPVAPIDNPFARFFSGRSESPVAEARPAVRAEVPRPRSEPIPERPAESLPLPRALDELKRARRVSKEGVVAIEIPPEPPRIPHAEDRVSSWSRSLRNTVGRWFGGAGAESRPVESSPVEREGTPTPEVSRRTAGGLMGVLSRFFGPKAFADVPQYLPESFGDQNARALLQADILDAMEENAATMKNVAGDPDRIHAANLEASERLDRAIATSTLSSEAKVEMRNRVVALQEKYTERTRENAVARSRELAGIVEQQVRVLEAPGRRGSLAMRLLSKLPFGVGINLAHGVGDFRKRFETAVSRGGDAGLVARVATVFRETWEEAMVGIRASGNLSDRAMNTAEAVAMIGSAYGVSATVTALEQVLPSLRSLSGGERDAMSRLAAEGRLEVQDAMDNVLPRAEQAMRRAA